MMKITRKLLRSWDACYSDEHIAALVPEDGLPPLEVADMDSVTVLDRIWVLLRPAVLGDSLPAVVDRIVEDAIRCVLGRSGSPWWEAWASAWLHGSSRTEAAARAAAEAAASDAARAAARAAQLVYIMAALAD
jgi:hypothetical protein